ncbi:head-tail connector protein [Clostridium algidicarnis]|uniref:Head-tail connector protein n=1 Tax=Clostridium algidicarnis TaxID=37659 RepID=A0ABS6C6H6_9CLOT|nr:head-tail connector protein [Clostridium algidicarnis]
MQCHWWGITWDYSCKYHRYIWQPSVTAEEICEGILRYPISEFTTVPETVKQAVLYAVSNMYENRENFETKEVLETMTRLLFSYRRESW